MSLPTSPSPYLSVIVCVYNEAGNIRPLVTQINQALPDISYELIYVNDGSTDQTLTELRSLADPNLIILDLQKNYGQSLALAAGIDAARGAFVATLDGDQQNDPADILNLLTYCVAQDLDFVSGVRAKRQDGFWLRKLPSRLANGLIRWSTDVKLRDLGCGLKVIRTETARQLGLYGELHRFLAVLAQLKGARLGELPVNHRPRQVGQSKYGLSRTFKVISDLLLLLFLKKYARKPMHLFGGVGGMMIGMGIVLTILYAIGYAAVLTSATLLVVGGLQALAFGLVLEMMLRNRYESSGEKPYTVRRTYSRSGGGVLN
jgi:glycosyltransferase involved in cell wall biosynthesis